MLFIENMYSIIIIIIKNVWLTTVAKKKAKGLDISPSCLCFSVSLVK